MQKNLVFVDSREGAMRESGDVILSGAKIYAELGEALAGKVPARASETDRLQIVRHGGGRYRRSNARVSQLLGPLIDSRSRCRRARGSRKSRLVIRTERRVPTRPAGK